MRRHDPERQRRQRERAALARSRVDLVALIQPYVQLKRRGSEFVGICPFHDERSASFYVSEAKQLFNCFGCHARGDAIQWVRLQQDVSFDTALDILLGDALPAAVRSRRPQALAPAGPPPAPWVVIMPVPEYAPPIVVGEPVLLVLPKWGYSKRVVPVRVDAYRNGQGELLGYILREDKPEGGKDIRPATWCISPDGEAGWTARAFPELRPLQGLDDLARRPDAPVLVVSGEKCREVGARMLPDWVVMTWPGGDQGFAKADWLPLRGRDVVLWHDADKSGWHSMLGFEDRFGVYHDGVANAVTLARADSVSFVDLDMDPASGLAPGLPEGWDLADAVLLEGWSPAQLRAWLQQKTRGLAPRASDRRAA